MLESCCWATEAAQSVQAEAKRWAVAVVEVEYSMGVSRIRMKKMPAVQLE